MIINCPMKEATIPLNHTDQFPKQIKVSLLELDNFLDS